MAADPNDPNDPPASDQGMSLEDLTSEAAETAPSGDTGNESSEEEASQKFATDLESVFDVNVNVAAVLGKTEMEVSQLLKLGRGAIVELDRKVGEAIEIYVNSRLIARGEVVVVEDQLGITMTEIVKGGAI